MVENYKRKKFNRVDEVRYREKRAYEIWVKNPELTWEAIGERLGISGQATKASILRYMKMVSLDG